jgi:uncharacterized protein (DUF1697 family)
MSYYVALLRGIGPGNPNMSNEKLRRVCEELGFSQVSSVISSGNVIFTSALRNQEKMEKMLEAAWPQKLGFTSTTIIRSQAQLQALHQKAPFKGYDHSAKTSLNVTFLQRPLPASTAPAGRGYNILHTYEREICSVVDTTSTKTPSLMSDLEKQFGKQMTTRTWLTVEKILKKMESGG